MNYRDAYDRADWKKSDVEIAAKLGVTKQAVQAARRVRGIQPAAGHGGGRKKSGAKRSDKYAAINWRMPDKKIAEKLGLTVSAVNAARARRGIKQRRKKKGVPRKSNDQVEAPPLRTPNQEQT